MKAITHFVRDDGAEFRKNENGTFSLIPIHVDHFNNEYTEEYLLSFRKRGTIIPVYEKCKCNWCEEMSPRVKRVASALNTPELQADFEYIMSAYGAESLDKDVLQSRLDGVWPGSEWIIEAKQLYDNAHPVNGHGGLY